MWLTSRFWKTDGPFSNLRLATYDFASSTLSQLCSFSNWLRGHCLDFVAGSPSEWSRMQHWSAVTGGSNLRPVITGLLWIFVKRCFGFPLGLVSSVRVLPQRLLTFTIVELSSSRFAVKRFRGGPSPSLHSCGRSPWMQEILGTCSTGRNFLLQVHIENSSLETNFDQVLCQRCLI